MVRDKFSREQLAELAKNEDKINNFVKMYRK
jgi:hypothetical protein